MECHLIYLCKVRQEVVGGIIHQVGDHVAKNNPAHADESDPVDAIQNFRFSKILILVWSCKQDPCVSVDAESQKKFF